MTTLKEVQRVSGGENEEHGHLEEFRTDPIGLMWRIRNECGDAGWFQLADKQVVMLSGAEANEFFFRSSDSELNQAEAYPFMTPVFGEGDLRLSSSLPVAASSVLARIVALALPVLVPRSSRLTASARYSPSESQRR